MSRTVTLRWEADPWSYGGRRARQSFDYDAFVPDAIAQLDVRLTGQTALLVSLAESEVGTLNGGSTTGGSEAVAGLLLRSESVASSRIEGLELSQRNLAKALFIPETARRTARAVAANVRAMEDAISIGAEDRPFLANDIKHIHSTLLRGTRDNAMAGHIRTVQNWIGGRLDSPLDAEFVPPPPGDVMPLLNDLVAFINREDMPAVVQAAIAHAQFETIHPFEDGNGRVGRALIHAIFRRRGLAPRFVPPISVVLATNANAYVQGLTDYRNEKVDRWCGSFAYTSRLAAGESVSLGSQIGTMQDEWRERAGRPRRGSSAARIIELLPAVPIMTVASAQERLGVSDEAARLGLTALEKARVVRQVTAGRYARAWAADDLFELLNSFEHRLATPTRGEQPRRPAPRN
ncbi:MAG: Fic family protein [Chloroflexota bacterium]